MFFNRNKKEDRKQQIAQLYKGAVIEISKIIVEKNDSITGFQQLNNYENLLLRLFIHVEAMMLSGGREYVNGVMHCIGGHLVKNNCVGSVEEFVNGTGEMFNELHPLFEDDMRMGKGVPIKFRRAFIEKFYGKNNILEIDIFLISKEMSAVMILFKNLCAGYTETFTNLEKEM